MTEWNIERCASGSGHLAEPKILLVWRMEKVIASRMRLRWSAFFVWVPIILFGWSATGCSQSGKNSDADQGSHEAVVIKVNVMRFQTEEYDMDVLVGRPILRKAGHLEGVIGSEYTSAYGQVHATLVFDPMVDPRVARARTSQMLTEMKLHKDLPADVDIAIE